MALGHSNERGSAERLARLQGVVWVVSGLWPIIHLKSFTRVTGPKPEGWLVKTVGSLIAVVGGTLLAAAWRRRITPEVRFLGGASAAALTTVDVVYATRRRISPVYLLDALLEGAFVLGWLADARAEWRTHSARAAEAPPSGASRERGWGWDIHPGETRRVDPAVGRLYRDVVEEASMESFPASDSPGYHFSDVGPEEPGPTRR